MHLRDAAGTSQNKFRKNPRKDWYFNLEKSPPKATAGDVPSQAPAARDPRDARVRLHADLRLPRLGGAQRTNPIGTGPFKFVELKQNESIKLVKNPDYWKKGLPYLDGIEYTIIPNRSTAILGFVAGKFDITFPTEVSIPLLKDVKAQKRRRGLRAEQTNVATNLIINRESAPFDNADVRRRSRSRSTASPSSDIMFEGNSDLGGAMLPPPRGVWGLPPEELQDRHRLRRRREEEPRRGAQADGEGGYGRTSGSR
jgi:peptide/nickel transport system substrate-binding protein